ncbi:hypothetical protein M9458_037785, partial [Cirrhinus mrigala]
YSFLTTLDGGEARGYVDVPRVELAVAAHLCQAASALHAMAILQVHQAKALKKLHEGSPESGLMQELRTLTDFVLRLTNVQVMSTMVFQECHLWLNLAQMRDADKVHLRKHLRPHPQGLLLPLPHTHLLIKRAISFISGSFMRVLIVSDALLPHTQTRSMNSPLNVELQDCFLCKIREDEE